MKIDTIDRSPSEDSFLESVMEIKYVMDGCTQNDINLLGLNMQQQGTNLMDIIHCIFFLKDFQKIMNGITYFSNFFSKWKMEEDIINKLKSIKSKNYLKVHKTFVELPSHIKQIFISNSLANKFFIIIPQQNEGNCYEKL